MSNPIEYNYENAQLEIKLPKGWKFYLTFYDDVKCNGVNLNSLINYIFLLIHFISFLAK